MMKYPLKGWVKIDTENNEIIGYNPDRQSAQIGPDLPNFKGYFIIFIVSFDVEFGELVVPCLFGIIA